MIQAGMDLLDLRGMPRWRLDQDVAMRLEPAAALAGQADYRHAPGLRRLGRLDDIAGIARGADAEQHAAGPAMGLDLPGIERVVAVVVAPGRGHRRIGAQRHAVPRPA